MFSGIKLTFNIFINICKLIINKCGCSHYPTKTDILDIGPLALIKKYCILSKQYQSFIVYYRKVYK